MKSADDILREFVTDDDMYEAIRFGSHYQKLLFAEIMERVMRLEEKANES